MAKLLTLRYDLVKAEDFGVMNAVYYDPSSDMDVKLRLRLSAPYPMTAFDHAVAGDYDKVVAVLMVEMPNWVTEVAKKELHTIIRLGCKNVFTYLLNAYPSLIDTTKKTDGFTVLHSAAYAGHDDMVTQILALRPEMVTAIDNEGRTPLQCAACEGHEKVAEKILAIKPDLVKNISSGDGRTILHEAILGRCSDEFVEKLWRMNPQALHHADLDSHTPFFAGMSRGRDKLIELFQWHLSFADIEDACFQLQGPGFTRHLRFRPVMEGECAQLWESLPRDVANTVFEYLGFDINLKHRSTVAEKTLEKL